MPVMLGAFETSLRGGDSPSVDRRAHMHKGCCGNLHGHGVKKERSTKEIPIVSRSCSLTPYCENSSSGDEYPYPMPSRHSLSPVQQQYQHLRVNSPKGVSDLITSLVGRRSQSTDYCGGGNRGNSLLSPEFSNTLLTKRDSNASVANRLYSSPTKSTTAKLRAERSASDSRRVIMSVDSRRSKSSGTKTNEDQDSGNFSSEDDARGRGNESFANTVTPTPEERRQSLIHGISDDEVGSMEEIRRRQRLERRDYVNNHKTNSPSRRESPSPGPKKRNFERGRKSSDDSDSSSVSPPTSPSPTNSRAVSNRPWTNSSKTMTSNNLTARRTKSSGNAATKAKYQASKGAYAFGSSTKRFTDDAEQPNRQKSPSKKFMPPPLNKSNSDGVQNSVGNGQLGLSRTNSDSSKSKIAAKRNERMQEVADAWMRFKDDIENAMEKKPNHGFYKNLSDMMHTKMEMLDQVGDQISPSAYFLGSNFWRRRTRATYVVLNPFYCFLSWSRNFSFV